MKIKTDVFCVEVAFMRDGDVIAALDQPAEQ